MSLVPFGQSNAVVNPDIFANIFAGVTTLEKKFVEKFPSLSFKGGKFHCIIDGGSHTIKDEEGAPMNKLDVVVVGIPPGRSNILFPEYDEDNPQPPICASVNGRTPDANFEKPFSANCQTCEKKIKVRDAKGKERAPCQQMMNLAVVIQGQSDKIYKVKLPITAIYNKESENADYKAWDQYTNHLRKNGVMHPAMVVTRISFDGNAQYPRPVFKAVGHLNEQMLQAIAPAIQSEVTKEITHGSPEQLGNGEQRVIPLKPVETPAPTSAPVQIEPEPVEEVVQASGVDEEAIRDKIEAEVRAKIEAEMAKKTAQPAATEAPKPAKPKKAEKEVPVVASDADLDAALADW